MLAQHGNEALAHVRRQGLTSANRRAGVRIEHGEDALGIALIGVIGFADLQIHGVSRFSATVAAHLLAVSATACTDLSDKSYVQLQFLTSRPSETKTTPSDACSTPRVP